LAPPRSSAMAISPVKCRVQSSEFRVQSDFGI
jgi:hypothetical protein